MAPVPTIRQRRLAAELKRLREASGLTLEQVADQIGISRSSLSRVENALVGAKLPVVKALLQLYGVQQGQMDALIQLT
ncbi:MAG: helix-turn-helix domain-containing protein, partial [Micromonosporaceae bacterium]|nr:helix-turn-helix domain-containing protein [Micromonosporaceae bacterium]